MEKTAGWHISPTTARSTVSQSYMWIGCEHQAQHEVGKDLTEELAQEPHGEEMLESVKLVGILI